MSTLAEIEAAADSLSHEEKEALLRFLADRLHDERDVTRHSKQTDLSEFAGIIRLTEDPLDWQRRIRAEWE